MVICGYFKIKSLSEPDAKGNNTQALCENCLDTEGGMEYQLYLAPYLRENMCGISVGSKVFGVADDATGLGCAVFGVDCDVDYAQKSDFNFKANVVIDGNTSSKTGNFTTTSGDVVASGISLKSHRHQLITIPSTDCATIIAAPSSGLPAAVLTATYTIIPDAT